MPCDECKNCGACNTRRRRQAQLDREAAGFSVDISAFPTLPLDDYDLLPSQAGIYFVIVGDKVVYIGQSQNLLLRWRMHISVFRGWNLTIAYWLTSESADWRRNMERMLIHHFKPELNGRLVKLPRTKGKRPIGVRKQKLARQLITP